jgi:hypothetical protein
VVEKGSLSAHASEIPPPLGRRMGSAPKEGVGYTLDDMWCH